MSSVSVSEYTRPARNPPPQNGLAFVAERNVLGVPGIWFGRAKYAGSNDASAISTVGPTPTTNRSVA